MSLHTALRFALAAGDSDAGMRAAFDVARQAGLDDQEDADAAAARALMRRMAVAGRADLAFGRMFEGHINAMQLVLTHGDVEQIRTLRIDIAAGAILGVWNSDAPDRGLRVVHGRFAGAKNFASGAGIVTHALVTTDANDPTETRMYLCDLRRGDASIDRGWWRPIGMARSETHIVDLTGLPAPAPIGPRGAYQQQPAFSAGALRFVAVQAGGVHALFDAVRNHLVATDRARHPIQRHRLARLFGLADAGYALVDRTADVWSVTDPTRIVPLVAAARGAIEANATEALALAQAAVGVQGLMAGHPLARVVTDLSVYLRQPNPDGARDAVGDAAAAGTITPGDINA